VLQMRCAARTEIRTSACKLYCSSMVGCVVMHRVVHMVQCILLWLSSRMLFDL
jgi:hypothetical protein